MSRNVKYISFLGIDMAEVVKYFLVCYQLIHHLSIIQLSYLDSKYTVSDDYNET